MNLIGKHDYNCLGFEFFFLEVWSFTKMLCGAKYYPNCGAGKQNKGKNIFIVGGLDRRCIQEILCS